MDSDDKKQQFQPSNHSRHLSALPFQFPHTLLLPLCPHACSKFTADSLLISSSAASFFGATATPFFGAIFMEERLGGGWRSEKGRKKEEGGWKREEGVREGDGERKRNGTTGDGGGREKSKREGERMAGGCLEEGEGAAGEEGTKGKGLLGEQGTKERMEEIEERRRGRVFF
uniref:Uncharacterized protein n=1 Tax=Solanum lycopersicum TaxID=4081 RepID=A0A3Q7IIV0_SOLLC